jgi:hypothetical protein
MVLHFGHFFQRRKFFVYKYNLSMIQLYLFILHGESSEAGIMMKEREALGFTLE